MSKHTFHKVTLTEGQIGIILCSLEDSINNSNHTRSEGNEILQPFDSYCQAVDTIFEILEKEYQLRGKLREIISTFYTKIDAHKFTQIQVESIKGSTL